MFCILQEGRGSVPFTKTMGVTGEGGTDILEKSDGSSSWKGRGLTVGVPVLQAGSLLSVEMTEC